MSVVTQQGATGAVVGRTVGRVAPSPVVADPGAIGLAPSERPLRLTRRGRVVVIVASLGLAVGIATAGGSAMAGAVARPTATHSRGVEAGDTLWSIAASITPAGSDVRDSVRLLMELNELNGPDLQAGQVLQVPDQA